jgi:hypothetical protein
MIFIWQGFGFLAVLLPFCISLLGQIVVDAVIEKGYYHPHPSVPATLLILCAAAIWYIGKTLSDRPGRLLVDPKTGHEIELKNKHTLFWIPLQWTSLLVAALGVSLLFR